MQKTNGVASSIKISEIFEGLQGEGRYAGTPMLFIRVSGCTRKCDFCFGIKHSRRVPRVMIANGVNKHLDKVVVGDKLLTLDKSHNLVLTTVNDVITRSVDKWYQIRIDSHSYYVTPEHPFFTKRGLVSAKNLLVNDIIYHVSNHEKHKFFAKNYNSMQRKDVAAKQSKTLRLSYKSGRVISPFVSYNKKVASGLELPGISKLKSTNLHRYKEVCLASSKRMSGKNNAYFKTPEKARLLHSKRFGLLNKGCVRSEETRKKMGLAKLGSKNPMKRFEVSHKNFLSHKHTMSNYEKRFLNIARNVDIDVNYVGDGALQIGYKYPDFVVGNTKKLCEIYSSSFPYKNGKRTVDNTYFDRRRELFKKHGYEVEFFDLDLKDDIVLEKLLQYIHNGKVVQSIKYIDRNDKKYRYEYQKPKSLVVYNFSCSPHTSYVIDNMWVHNCDTQYHTDGKEYSIQEIVDVIKKYQGSTVCFTGGEPLLYKKQLREICLTLYDKKKMFHLESNGDLLDVNIPILFDYIAISPKEYDTAVTCSVMLRHLDQVFNDFQSDIKVVTDAKEVGMDMLDYATMLMPLTTNHVTNDLKIKQDVWNLCIKKNLRFSPRMHIDVWGYKCRTK